MDQGPSWNERVERALAEGAPVFRKNGLPFVCQRADGALLEHEHADHPSYLFPVEVEYALEKPDTFRDQCVDRGIRPEHERHEIEWTLDGSPKAFCKTCQRALSEAEVVHIQSYLIAEIECSQYEPHDEALIFRDDAIAVTLYECCYTVWRRKDGSILHGPTWSKDWRLTRAAIAKIWP